MKNAPIRRKKRIKVRHLREREAISDFGEEKSAKHAGCGGHLPGLFDHFEGNRFQVKRICVAPFAGAGPLQAGGVAGRVSLAAKDGTPVIHDHVVISDPAVFLKETVHDFDDALRLNGEASFLKDFALYAFDEGFAEFKQAAGDGPVAFARLVGALHQQDVSAGIDNDAADADQWMGGEFALGQDDSRSS